MPRCREKLGAIAARVNSFAQVSRETDAARLKVLRTLGAPRTERTRDEPPVRIVTALRRVAYTGRTQTRMRSVIISRPCQTEALLSSYFFAGAGGAFGPMSIALTIRSLCFSTS
jgi:hypothetical protein